ncbi:MAG: DNA repair protein RecO, partial [Cyanobacteria bacterium J06636_16]
MSRSYKATGINLKGMPMGETDRLLTILTAEQGLIRVLAPGARKHKSRLAGRSSQFVVNNIFVVQGKRLDKLVQADTVRSFPGLSADLAKLTASQYLAELVLCQALSEQPQEELFTLLVEHLQRLEQATGDGVLACLNQ